MKGIYQIMKSMEQTLSSYEGINTVTIGDLSEIDLNMQTIYPLAHIELGQAIPPVGRDEGTVTHNMTIFVLDILDQTQTDAREEQETYWGNDNLLDVWHETMQTALQLVESLRRGDLFDAMIQLEAATLDPVYEAFENLLAGWTLSLTIKVPSSAYTC